MSNELQSLIVAIIGKKQTISARVYRQATGTWEDHRVVSETRVGGLIPTLKQLTKKLIYGK